MKKKTSVFIPVCVHVYKISRCEVKMEGRSQPTKGLGHAGMGQASMWVMSLNFSKKHTSHCFSMPTAITVVQALSSVTLKLNQVSGQTKSCRWPGFLMALGLGHVWDDFLPSAPHIEDPGDISRFQSFLLLPSPFQRDLLPLQAETVLTFLGFVSKHGFEFSLGS